MSTSTEQQPRDLVDGSDRRARKRRHAQLGWVTLGAVAVTAVGVLGIGALDQGKRNTPDMPHGPLKGGSADLCMRMFVPSLLPSTSFAFDGTVAAIGGPDRSWRGPFPEVSVTFTVHDWFRGGSGDTVVIGMSPPQTRDIDSTISTYQVGTRLLVSGTAGSGQGPNHLHAWTGCGYTRYHDPQEAQRWAAATK